MANLVQIWSLAERSIIPKKIDHFVCGGKITEF